MRSIVIVFLLFSSFLQAQNVIIGRVVPPLNGEMISDTFLVYNHLTGTLRGGDLYNSDYWSPVNNGAFSFAYGRNTLASGLASFAIGAGTKAEGVYGIAAGLFTEALGDFSFASGNSTKALGDYSFATGKDNMASGEGSYASGFNNIATGRHSHATGLTNIASGSASFSAGSGVYARSLCEMAIGRYGTDYVPQGSGITWNENDRVFVVGNGTGTGIYRSNAMVLLKNGDVRFPDGSFLVGRDSMPQNGELVSEKLIFYDNEKGAFRGGILSNSINCSPDSTGIGSFGFGFNILAGDYYSTAFGVSTKASGYVSFASGQNSQASGDLSFASGNGSLASGDESFASGGFTQANGEYSFAAGFGSKANGVNSFAAGLYTRAESFLEFTIGSNNTDFIANSTADWIPEDRLFVIGNGTNELNRSDAMVVLKNGNTSINGDVNVSDAVILKSNGRLGIRESNPDKEFHVKGQAKIEAFNAGSDANLYMQSGTGLEGRVITYQKNNEDFYFGDIDNVGNNIFIRAGGAERITILDNGNVGIGSNYPLEKLVVVGNIGVVGNICYTGSIGGCSDLRFKRDFQPIISPLSKINQLNGLYYFWNQDQFPEKEFSSERQIGVIAQEVEALFPEMVLTDSEGYKSVDYSRLTPVLIEAVKELNKQNEELTTRMDKMEKQLALLVEVSN